MKTVKSTKYLCLLGFLLLQQFSVNQAYASAAPAAAASDDDAEKPVVEVRAIGAEPHAVCFTPTLEEIMQEAASLPTQGFYKPDAKVQKIDFPRFVQLNCHLACPDNKLKLAQIYKLLKGHSFDLGIIPEGIGLMRELPKSSLLRTAVHFKNDCGAVLLLMLAKEQVESKMGEDPLAVLAAITELLNQRSGEDGATPAETAMLLAPKNADGDRRIRNLLAILSSPEAALTAIEGFKTGASEVMPVDPEQMSLLQQQARQKRVAAALVRLQEEEEKDRVALACKEMDKFGLLESKQMENFDLVRKEIKFKHELKRIQELYNSAPAPVPVPVPVAPADAAESEASEEEEPPLPRDWNRRPTLSSPFVEGANAPQSGHSTSETGPESGREEG